MKEFESAKIHIPEDMAMFQDGTIRPYHVSEKDPILVVYVSPEECSACKVAHLDFYDELFSWSDSLQNLSVMIILSPPVDEIGIVQEKLLESNFRNPVYLDLYSEFTSKNKIPSDRRFHCFLLDKDKSPVIVGYPFSNDKIKSLYNKTLATL